MIFIKILLFECENFYSIKIKQKYDDKNFDSIKKH